MNNARTIKKTRIEVGPGFVNKGMIEVNSIARSGRMIRKLRRKNLKSLSQFLFAYWRNWRNVAFFPLEASLHMPSVPA